MRLEQLAEYVRDKYHIEEQHKWADFPDYSVLADPVSGKWFALLMRQWDAETGEIFERCDIKCGMPESVSQDRPYLSAPFRMHGRNWAGITLDEDTDSREIYGLIDKAYQNAAVRSFTITLDGRRPSAGTAPSGGPYRDTALPLPGRGYAQQDHLPEKLRKMMELFEYGDGSFRQKCKNFYIQGMFMKDYEDSAPWDGEYLRFFPTYHDLRPEQLRGYFTWRAGVRKGEYTRAATAFAYIYIYELLNGIGADTPAEVLEKLGAFEAGCCGLLDDSAGVKRNLRKWQLEFSVVNGMEPATARKYADPLAIETDTALAALKKPEQHTDREVFSALCFLAGRKADFSPAASLPEEEGIHLLAEIWRYLSAHYHTDGKSIFTACFGTRISRRWNPLADAVYWDRRIPVAAKYELNECRTYVYGGEAWTERSWHRIYFDNKKLTGLLHNADRKLRIYLKTGRKLAAREEEAWSDSFIDAVIEAYRQAKIEAARPVVKLDLSGLDRIREDAAVTRDSLLTEEEIRETEEEVLWEPETEEAFGEDSETADSQPGAAPGGNTLQLPLDGVQLQIMRNLLDGIPAYDIIAANHLMPSVTADAINEAMFDLIGDNVLECDGSTIVPVEDYLEDLRDIFGGM